VHLVANTVGINTSSVNPLTAIRVLQLFYVILNIVAAKINYVR